MTGIEDHLRRAARTARAAGEQAIDLDTDLAAAAARADSLPLERRLVPPNGWAWRPLLAVAAVLLIAVLAGSLVLLRGSDDQQIATVTVPATSDVTMTTTVETTVAPAPVPSLPLQDTGTTTEATTPTTTVAPGGGSAVGGAVSYLNPPPTLSMRSLGRMEYGPPGDGEPSFGVAIGDLGVVAIQPWPGLVTVFGFDGSRREVEIERRLENGLFETVYGPGDVLYGLSTVGSSGTQDIVAIPLTGDRAGEVVASVPLDANYRYFELPAAPLGHGPEGVIDRVRDVNGTLIGYVDEDGASVGWSAARPPLLSGSSELDGEPFTVSDDAGTSWQLEIQTAPERRGIYNGPSPAAPSSNGLAVYWTHLGTASPGDDYDDPTTWVIAALHPDGTVRWWSVPDGWSVVASDVWGTVLAKRDTAASLELALADFGVETVAPPDCVQHAIRGRVRSVVEFDGSNFVVSPDGVGAATLAELLAVDPAAFWETNGDLGGADGWAVVGADDLYVVAPDRGPTSASGHLVSTDAEVTTMPVAGPAATLANGVMLVVGGPNRDMVAVSDATRSSWNTALDIHPPPPAPGIGLQWFEFGRPAPRDATRFWLPAVLNASPADRSSISRTPQLLTIGADGSVHAMLPLDVEQSADGGVRTAAAADGTTWVVSDAGDLDAFSASGSHLWHTEIEGAPLDIAADGSGVAVLVGTGPDGDVAATGRLLICAPTGT